MTKLGTYPSRRLQKAWVTQRLVNRAAPETHLRENHASYGQQILNEPGIEIQDTIQRLTDYRYNQFLSTADLSQLDVLYKAELPEGMTFSYEDDVAGREIYSPPTVYAMIDDVEYEITIAENNDLETLGYEAIPSRIEYSDVSEEYFTIIPETEISDLSTLTPQDLAIDSYLYITLKENTTWETRAYDKIYFSKCSITGILKKGVEVTEVVPLRYNGTFRTLNEWHSISSISVSYLDDTAKLTVEIFPFNRDSILDTRNIYVPTDAFERPVYLRLSNERTWGSSLVSESFTTHDMDVVRTGLEEKEIYYEIELLDSDNNNIEAIDFVPKPFGRFAYVLAAKKLYVYDISWPSPDYQKLTGESPEARIDLIADTWIVARDEIATVKTHNLASADVPYKYRWIVTDPNGTDYYVRDGVLVPTTDEETWLENELWDLVSWRETELELQLDEIGEWIFSIECVYYNERYDEVVTLITKYMFYVPSITPEITFDLPDEVKDADGIWIDSENSLWIYKENTIYKLNIYYDYFVADYLNNMIWLREDYTSVRVVV